MSPDKARDNFSAYYEGTLDRGLKQAFERALESDSQVQAEYNAFQVTMAQLESMAFEVPEPEFDLHDRIMARLDLHRLEERKTARPSLFANWRLLTGAVALGALALVAVKFSGTSNSASTAGITTFPIKIEGLTVTQSPSDQFAVVLTKASPSAAVIISNTVTDEKFETRGNELVNGDEKAQTFQVTLSGEKDHLYIALPGKKSNVNRVGSGNLLDFARAAADTYRVPFVVAVEPVNQVISWNFTDTNVDDSMKESLKPLGATVDSSGKIRRITKQ